MTKKINRDRTQPADMREASSHTIRNEFEKTWNRKWYLSKQMWNFYLNEHTVASRNKLLLTNIRPNGLSVSLKLVLFYWMGKVMSLETLNLHEITVIMSNKCLYNSRKEYKNGQFGRFSQNCRDLKTIKMSKYLYF